VYFLYVRYHQIFQNQQALKMDDLFSDEIETGKPEKLNSSAVIPDVNNRCLQS
jgi:hypothetical protein